MNLSSLLRTNDKVHELNIGVIMVKKKKKTPRVIIPWCMVKISGCQKHEHKFNYWDSSNYETLHIIGIISALVATSSLVAAVQG